MHLEMAPCSKCKDCRVSILPTMSGHEPFAVMESRCGTYGRHLVASRDLARGEVVFAEPPLVVGPWSPDVPVCVVCLEAGVATLEICGRCGFDICRDCSHEGEECAELSRARSLREMSRGIKYPVLTVLRMLRLKVTHPEAWKRLNFLSSGSKACERLRRRHHLCKKIAECLADTAPVEEVLRMIGIRNTNAKSVGNGCVAVYPTFSLMNSDCSRANTRHVVDGRTKEIVVRAATDFIGRGDELTV